MTDGNDVKWVNGNTNWAYIENTSESDTAALQYQCPVNTIWRKYKAQLVRPNDLPREARIRGARLRLDTISKQLSGDDRCLQCCDPKPDRQDGGLHIQSWAIANTFTACAGCVAAGDTTCSFTLRSYFKTSKPSANKVNQFLQGVFITKSETANAIQSGAELLLQSCPAPAGK